MDMLNLSIDTLLASQDAIVKDVEIYKSSDPDHGWRWNNFFLLSEDEQSAALNIGSEVMSEEYLQDIYSGVNGDE